MREEKGQALLPEELDPFIWRIVASDTFSVSLVEVETQWSLLDVIQAHDILDEIAASRGSDG